MAPKLEDMACSDPTPRPLDLVKAAEGSGLRNEPGAEPEPLRLLAPAPDAEIRELADRLPCVDMAHDGFGNYWVADLTSRSTEWGPIYFACHDPPVVVFQSPNLSHFLAEVLKLGDPTARGASWTACTKTLRWESGARIRGWGPS